jgi:hypothetical protein
MAGKGWIRTCAHIYRFSPRFNYESDQTFRGKPIRPNRCLYHAKSGSRYCHHHIDN